VEAHSVEIMIRKATAADVPAVLGLVRILAEFERAPHEVTLTESQMVADLESGHFDAWLAWNPRRRTSAVPPSLLDLERPYCPP